MTPTVGTGPGPVAIGREVPLDTGPLKGRETTSAAEPAEVSELQFGKDPQPHSLDGDWFLSGDPLLADIVDRVRTVDLAVFGLGDPPPILGRGAGTSLRGGDAARRPPRAGHSGGR